MTARNETLDGHEIHETHKNSLCTTPANDRTVQSLGLYTKLLFVGFVDFVAEIGFPALTPHCTLPLRLASVCSSPTVQSFSRL